MLTRTATPGPELDIVTAFLEEGIGRAARSGTAVSVFCEPLLETGYPDVVIVYWSQRCAEAWPACRVELTQQDIRFLHFLHDVGCVDRKQVPRFREARDQDAEVDRLVSAGVVRISKRWIRTRPLREIFAVRRIIAIEAKVTDWRRGLQQALLNTWFASESFLLLPQLPTRSSVVTRAAEIGVGIVDAGQRLSSPHLRPRHDRLPRSYASWLFNEWAWRGFGALRA